jgi:hypothetical protein
MSIYQKSIAKIFLSSFIYATTPAIMAIQAPKTSRDDPSAAADETTPLLNGTVEPPSQAAEEAIIHPAPEPNGNKNDDDDDDEKPLPKVQMFLLCFARLIEPAAFFGIFPFINKMIWENGSVEESDVGFYSGLIVCFPLCSPHTSVLLSPFHLFRLNVRIGIGDCEYRSSNDI